MVLVCEVRGAGRQQGRQQQQSHSLSAVADFLTSLQTQVEVRSIHAMRSDAMSAASRNRLRHSAAYGEPPLLSCAPPGLLHLTAAVCPAADAPRLAPAMGADRISLCEHQ